MLHDKVNGNRMRDRTYINNIVIAEDFKDQ